MSLQTHEELIVKKHTKTTKFVKFLRTVLYIAIIAIIWYFTIIDRNFAASVWVFSAALVFSLQNFVASLIAYFYIRSASVFEKWDIIKTWNPFMSAMWEVLEMWFFFTKIREVDSEELAFTGKTVSFPNNLIFSGWIFNYTKDDLLFWYEFKVNISLEGQDFDTVRAKFKETINDSYDEALEDKIYQSSSLYNNKTYKPKYQIQITKEGLEVSVRLLIHFYKIFETNNRLMKALIYSHQRNEIKLLTHKDYQWID